MEELEKSKSGGTAIEEQVMSINAGICNLSYSPYRKPCSNNIPSSEKVEIERKLVDLKDRLNEQQQKSEEAQRQTKRAEKEKAALGDQIGQLGDSLARVEVGIRK